MKIRRALEGHFNLMAYHLQPAFTLLHSLLQVSSNITDFYFLFWISYLWRIEWRKSWDEKKTKAISLNGHNSMLETEKKHMKAIGMKLNDIDIWVFETDLRTKTLFGLFVVVNLLRFRVDCSAWLDTSILWRSKSGKQRDQSTFSFTPCLSIAWTERL